MYSLLYKYLMLHEQVAIPGVGRFYKHREPARQDFVNNMYQPPAHYIFFKEEQANADRKLYRFISKSHGMNEVEAIRYFHEFAYKIKEHVRHFNSIEMDGLGVLKRNANGSLTFIPENILDGYLSPTAAEKLPRHPVALVDATSPVTAEQQVVFEDQYRSKKSYWWVWALILGVAGVAAIAYYYWLHGNVKL